MNSALKNIRVASPCDVGFENMEGDDRIRFCGLCKLNVYNIGGMSDEEATELIESNEGQLCVRLYRRKDGTVLTDNCPVGLRKVRDRFAKVAIFAFILSSIGWLSGQQAHSQGLVGAPIDGGIPRGPYEPIKQVVECAKDNSSNLLLTVLFFLKFAIAISDKSKCSRETWYLLSYLVPFFCGTAVHFIYLGVTDEIVITVFQGLERSLTTGVTFGLTCLSVAILQCRLTGERNEKLPGRFIS